MSDNIIISERRIAVNVKVGVTNVSVQIGATPVRIVTAPPVALPVTGTWNPVSGTVAVPNEGLLSTDTRTAAATLNLPPLVDVFDGYRFFVRDMYGTFSTNYCNVVPPAGSGYTIIGLAEEETLELNYSPPGGFFLFVYNAADKTWSW